MRLDVREYARRACGTATLLVCLSLASPSFAEGPRAGMSMETDEDDQEDVAKDSTEIVLPQIDVVVHRPLTAASQRIVRQRDFLLLPRQTASDLLLNVPHLHISQHSGGGKGHQIFLRGFDAEHGEDLAIYLEGVPINLPSHIHGIGYTDMHFLIPEVVARMDVLKGPYDVRHGDFSVAGTVNFELKDSLGSFSSGTTYGRFNTFSQRLLFSPESDQTYGAMAIEAFRTDGFTANGGWRGGRFLGKLGKKWGRNDLHLLLGGYASEWEAADTVPELAVTAGELGFYEGVDDSDGGLAHRYHLSAHYANKQQHSLTRILAYLVHSRTLLFSNYTYFLKSPEHGDQTEQGDSRTYFGSRVEHSRAFKLGRAHAFLLLGGEYRGDLAEIEQWRTEKRIRRDLATHYDAGIHSLGLFLSGQLIPAAWCRIVAGARYDHFFFDLEGVEDLTRPSGYVDEEVPLSGTASDGIVSPKATIIFTPLSGWSIFLNYGRGFHSPDIRDIVRNSNAGLPDAHIGELSTRIRMGRWFDLAASFWLAYVEDEVFFDPDLGRSVGQGESRRLGGELEVRWAPWDFLMVYADVGYTDARLVSEDTPIVGSPRLTITGGAALRGFHGFRANLRVRHIGARPLDKGKFSDSATVVDLLAGYEYTWFAVDLVVENLFNSPWKDAQYYYLSRYRPDIENPEPGYHFTPGTPFSIKGTLTLKY